MPGVRRVGVVWDPDNPANATALESVRSAARRAALDLQVVEACDAEALDGAHDTLVRERVGAVLVVSEPVYGAARKRLAALQRRHGLPTMHGARANVEAGGLVYYGPATRDQVRRAAGYVDRILRGASPADLPVQQPLRFELVINLRAAQELGVAVPGSVLLRADEQIR